MAKSDKRRLREVRYSRRSVFDRYLAIHVVCQVPVKKPTTQEIGLFTTPSILI